MSFLAVRAESGYTLLMLIEKLSSASMRTQVAPKTRPRWNDCHMGLAAHRTFLLGVKQQLPMKSIAVLWRVLIWSMWQSMLSLKCISKDQAAVPAQYSSKGPLRVGLGQCHQRCHCPCQARCPGPHQPLPSTHLSSEGRDSIPQHRSCYGGKTPHSSEKQLWIFN